MCVCGGGGVKNSIFDISLSPAPKRALHYENAPMQYIGKKFCCKNENFHWKKFDFFLIFAQNIDCGYMLERPR